VKQFDQFISEARTTRASAEAKRLGLVGDGHGDWYDRQGSLKAKTIRGELKMYTPSKKEEDDTVQSSADADSSKDQKKAPADTSAKAVAGGAAGNGVDVDALLKQIDQFKARQQFDGAARSEPLTIAFDKFDSDEVGDNVIAAAQESAAGGQFYIFPSRDADIDRIKEAYGDVVVDNPNAETIYDVLQSIYESGYNAINIVVRKSRATEISKMAMEQNGKLYNYVMMNVIPVDERSIREQYISGDIFNIGDTVKSSDKVGKIIRRGANHLICLDEQQNVFRTWVNDTIQM
jgi:hypothetical protein|tara:strand:- start:1656 stop:2525 length:870 start_codon:yes stop_codon:yes gene_type:complete